MSISDPAPDSFRIRLTQVIGTKSKFHPILYKFNATVSMQGKDFPFAYLNAPEVKAVDGVEGKIDQRVVLPDVGAFTDFATAILLKPSVNITVIGKPQLKLGSLQKISVTYNKTVTLIGRISTAVTLPTIPIS
jgi:Protein of unknown function (DUF3712)